MTRLLLIEDDATLARTVATSLGMRSYDVQLAADGSSGLRLAADWGPDLVLLDVMMPGMDGWEVCRRLREEGTDIPVIMLTGRGMHEDIIHGLSVGADDYVRKPFNLRELELRVEAVLRRSRRRGMPDESIFDDGHMTIDLDRRVVARQGQPVHLTPTEFRLLACLVRRRNRAATHQELLRDVWGPEYVEETANLAVYIRYLREKLEEAPGSPRYICTVWGVGYRFGGQARSTASETQKIS